MRDRASADMFDGMFYVRRRARTSTAKCHNVFRGPHAATHPAHIALHDPNVRQRVQSAQRRGGHSRTRQHKHKSGQHPSRPAPTSPSTATTTSPSTSPTEHHAPAPTHDPRALPAHRSGRARARAPCCPRASAARAARRHAQHARADVLRAARRGAGHAPRRGGHARHAARGRVPRGAWAVERGAGRGVDAHEYSSVLTDLRDRVKGVCDGLGR